MAEIQPNLQQTVVAILAQFLEVDEDLIQMESYLNEQLGIDSSAAIELIFEIEDRFDLSIPNEDAEGFKQVQDIVRYLEQRPEMLPTS